MQKIAQHLSGALKIETTAEKGFSQNTFQAFHAYLKETYPLAAHQLEWKVFLEASLMLRWKGKTNKAPILLLGHMDVVPAGDEGKWTHPPFGGEIADGFLWGRGAIDDKHQIIFQMEAVERLLSQGFVPERDIYLCYGHNEETMPTPSGAGVMTEWFKEQGIVPALVLDEGGCVQEGTLFGKETYFSIVSLCEKGYLDVKISAEGKGGHSSIPNDNSALRNVCAAALAAESYPREPKVLPFVYEMYHKAVPGISDQVVREKLAQSPTGQAMTATSSAFTMVKGSDAANVYIPRAEAIINYRLLPGDTAESVLEAVKEAVKPYPIKAENIKSTEASPISQWDNAAARIVKKTIEAFFPDAPVIPYLMLGGSDAKFYADICDTVLRFVPIRLAPDVRNTMHMDDERIPLEALETGVAFYEQLLADAAWESFRENR